MRLKEYGSELIEVADNGSGIRTEDHEAFALKYYTSKISSFNEVSGVKTFGFRGEAISSLCAVSSLTVSTRTRDQDVAAKLAFDRNGALSGVVHIFLVTNPESYSNHCIITLCLLTLQE